MEEEEILEIMYTGNSAKKERLYDIANRACAALLQEFLGGNAALHLELETGARPNDRYDLVVICYAYHSISIPMRFLGDGIRRRVRERAKPVEPRNHERVFCEGTVASGMALSNKLAKLLGATRVCETPTRILEPGVEHFERSAS